MFICSYDVSGSAYTTRVNAIKLFFPFDLENSNQNVLKDPLSGTTFDVNASNTLFNAYNLPLYYILSQFEYSDTSGNGLKFLTTISVTNFDYQSKNII